MHSAATQLLEDPIELRAKVLRLQDRLAELERQREEHEQHIEQLLVYITLLKRKRFGPSADRISPGKTGSSLVIKHFHALFVLLFRHPKDRFMRIQLGAESLSPQPPFLNP